MKKDIFDISVGLERLGAAVRVLGTYTINHKCANSDGDIVNPIQIEMTFDLLADYADTMREQLDELMCKRSGSGLTSDEQKQASVIAQAWQNDRDMSEIMNDWDAEDVARVLLDTALTEETERQHKMNQISKEGEQKL